MPIAPVLIAPVLIASLQVIESQRVSFPPGSDSTRVQGQLKGYPTVDYKLRAGAGQTLTVQIDASSRQNYFNVNAAGSSDAMFIGAIDGTRFRGVLPSDGDVTVRVYLMRPAARRGDVSTYTLRMAITGTPLAPLPVSHDALVPGTPFHATAQIPCLTTTGGAAGRCPAGVIRRTNGGATVVVTTPQGQKRQFLFVKGEATATDQYQALKVQRRADLSVLSLGDNAERYEIADAFILGG